MRAIIQVAGSAAYVLSAMVGAVAMIVAAIGGLCLVIFGALIPIEYVVGSPPNVDIVAEHWWRAAHLLAGGAVVALPCGLFMEWLEKKGYGT